MGKQARVKAARRAATQGRTWTPFERATPGIAPARYMALVAEMTEEMRKRDPLVTREDVEEVIQQGLQQEMYENNLYTVLVDRKHAPGIIHLSIRRRDRERPGAEKWRDFQRIKNELIGEEHEGAELYPAESRVVDTADQFAMFVFADPGKRFAFGYQTGLKLDKVSPETGVRQTAR